MSKKKERTFMSFKRLLKLFPNKRYLIVGIMFTILLSFTTVFFSHVLKLIIDSVMDKNFDLFYQSLYVILGLIVVDIIGTYIKTRLLGTYAESGVSKLRKKLAEQLSKLKFERLSSKHSGDYVSRATNDIGKLRSFVSTTISQTISVPLTAIGAIIYLCILDLRLTLFSLVLIPVLFIGAGILSIPIGKISKTLQEKLGKVNGIAQDTIQGVEVSKAYMLEEDLGITYQKAVSEAVESGKQLAKRRSILESFSQFLGIIPFFTTFLLGGYFVIKGPMSVGELLAFINLLNQVTHPISALPRIWAEAKSSLAATDRIYEVLDEEVERIDGAQYSLDNSEPLISFKNVQFRYPDKLQLLFENLTISIYEGESIALVGPSGGGKSSIMKLLLGYYEHYEGEIIIGGHEVRKWSLKHLRNQIGFVAQDTFLFPETIEENIRYGKNNSDLNEVIESAKAANAHVFIEEFKDGYNTLVGELGNRLSGGQKQRLSIARAKLKDAPILLLDEATSALDTESEAIVRDALNKFMVGKTSITIAHRLSTIKHVDRILVVSGGRVVEEGTHEELLSINGVYSDLYNKQLYNSEDKTNPQVMGGIVNE
ncbi:ABC transporter ATP-binding protein [Haloplasma contractile]|uniref:ABC transporter protein n=1 Tax=Haloplasma contractile SSD-17B TaxID=1033810 RepID=U2EAI1_9MOLU|nr:ABC transporter ATP-binding protein [Haloplasma contractile]ERJ12108.1 ABC transporter protein [Haloplasma contractile SSD-17B]